MSGVPDGEIIEGRKRLVLKDCEEVVIYGGKYVSVRRVEHLHVTGCIGKSDTTIWEQFSGNRVDNEVGNYYPAREDRKGVVEFEAPTSKRPWWKRVFP